MRTLSPKLRRRKLRQHRELVNTAAAKNLVLHEIKVVCLQITEQCRLLLFTQPLVSARLAPPPTPFAGVLASIAPLFYAR